MVMELDERLRWIEIRVTSSLKPRAEELKHLFTNEKSRYTVKLCQLKIIVFISRASKNNACCDLLSILDEKFH